MTTAIHTEDFVKKFGRLEALKTLDLSVPQDAVYASPCDIRDSC